MLAICSSLSGSSLRPVDSEAIENDGDENDCQLSALEERYGDFTVLHTGRHSNVWSAKERASGETVVIKAYHKVKMNKPRHARHVVRETRLLQVFRDSRVRGVVRMQEAFEDNDKVYLIFEPCMRGDLFQLMMKNGGTLEEGFVAMHVIAPLLSTLSLLHAIDIVHRDIKTENIFLTSNGEVALGDFGLVAHKLHDALVDRVGTLDYMAPEVLSMPTTEDDKEKSSSQDSRKEYTEKVDVWAVGVLLYELLTGRPPFEVEDPRETARLILQAQLPQFPSHLPSDCINFISAALQRQPRDRPTAAELRDHAWLQRHMRSARPNSPAHLAATRSGALESVDVNYLKKNIYEAWKTDDLEQAMNSLVVTDSAMGSGDLVRNDTAMEVDGADICKTTAMPAAVSTEDTQDGQQQFETSPKQLRSRPSSNSSGGARSGSVYASAPELYPGSLQPEEMIEKPKHFAAASPRSLAMASEGRKLRSHSQSSYTVLGKALALSVGRLGASGTASPVTSGSIKGFEDSLQSFCAETSSDQGLIPAGRPVATSQSFTTQSGYGRVMPPEQQAWQRSEAPAQKPAAKGRSRFAN